MNIANERTKIYCENTIHNITCSVSCSAKKKRIVDWDEIDVVKLLLKNNKNYSKSAREVGISDNSVRKRLIRVLKSTGITDKDIEINGLASFIK